jgi:hypothetical protein
MSFFKQLLCECPDGDVLTTSNCKVGMRIRTSLPLSADGVFGGKIGAGTAGKVEKYTPHGSTPKLVVKWEGHGESLYVGNLSLEPKLLDCGKLNLVVFSNAILNFLLEKAFLTKF